MGWASRTRLLRMRRSLPLALVSMCVLGGGVPFFAARLGFAQDAASAESPQTGAVMTKLSPPVYPPLARQANIFGEVKLAVVIREDGTVASADVISGHPMLKQSALESAQQSHFECRGCGDSVTTLLLTYAFEMKDDGDCCSALPRTPEVTQSLNRIVIVAAHICLCDPGVTVGKKVRAAKCFYFWKCGMSER
jgi:TonB family protein